MQIKGQFWTIFAVTIGVMTAFQPWQSNAQDQQTSKAELVANCQKGALGLAAHMNVRTVMQLSNETEFLDAGIPKFVYRCSSITPEKPALVLDLEPRTIPNAKTAQMIAKAAEYLTGSRSNDIKKALVSCIKEALGPRNADREVTGVLLDCEAYRSMVSVVIRRESGAYPERAFKLDANAPLPNIITPAIASPPKEIKPERVIDGKLCRTDWSKCADNKQLAETFLGTTEATSACKKAAADKVRYGSPEWPWLAFSSFYGGDDAPRDGQITLVEPRAKISNAYGALENSVVKCTWNLKTKSIQDINIQSRP